jgi:ABC-type Mn2+/Zn2+ transport system ATPase subunit
VKEVFPVADTKKIEDKVERKKVKRAARKKAAPKAPRTGARGENKKKIKKLSRGQSKR